MNEKLLQVIKNKYGKRRQSEIAKASGLTEATISLIWSGKRGLTVETLIRLSSGLGVETWEVWREAGK